MKYRKILEIAKHSPEKVDFTKLRLSFAESEEYIPCIPDIDLAKKLERFLKDGDIKKASEVIKKILDNYYLDINAHVIADFIFDELNDKGKSYFHRTFAKGLIDSILDSGDGKTFETAYKVIDIREEYVILETMGILANHQEFVEWQGHKYDVFEEFDPATGMIKYIHFNIDIPKKWLDEYEIRKSLLN